MTLTVIGVGNRFAGDDGVGLVLAEALAEAPPCPGYSVMPREQADALTLAHDLLELPGPALIVDCADMGVGEGEWRCLSLPEELAAPSPSLSTHGLGLSEALALARALGYPHAVHLFGVQPYSLAMRSGLTRDMAARLPEILTGLRASVVRIVGASVPS
ncbi:MAG: hydrogenase maturation protease [Alphaproteobacteria bacterium]